MDVIDCIIGGLYDYYTVLLVFRRLETRHLIESLDMIRHRFQALTIELIVVTRKHFSRHFIQHRTPRTTNMCITLLQDRCTTMVIDVHHAFMDGTLVQNILSTWSQCYAGGVRAMRPTVNFLGNYSLAYPWFPALKKQYPFSDYIIATTLWSHFIAENTKTRRFGHVVSVRPARDVCTPGNFISVIEFELSESVLVSCQRLHEVIAQEKRTQSRVSAFLPSAVNLVKCRVIFDSWLSFKHVKFAGAAPYGIYKKNFLTSNLNVVERIAIVGIHNNSYYMKQGIQGCSEESFISFMKHHIH